MKLHLPEFERSLRRKVKIAVRASPQLRKEARRRQRAQQLRLTGLFRVLATALLAYGMWHSAITTERVAAPVALLTLWTAALVFFRANDLLFCLYQSPDLAAFSVLPVESGLVLRWSRQRFFRHSSYLFVDIFAGCAAMALGLNVSGPMWALVIPVTLIAGISAIGAAALLAVHAPVLVRILAPLLGVMWILIFIVTRVVPLKNLWRVMEEIGPMITTLLPTGWALAPLELFLPEGNSLRLLALLPTAAMVASLRYSFARLGPNYDFGEVELPEAPDLVPGIESPPSETEVPEVAPFRVGNTTIEEIVMAREFLRQPAWSENGWAETRLWKWFTPRERALSEFAFGERIRISGTWGKISRNLFIGAAAAFALKFFAPVIAFWTAGIALLVVAGQTLASFLATGKAFQKVFCSGVVIPIYAAYPVGYRELSRLFFNYSLVQLPYLIPFMIGATAVAFQIFGRFSTPTVWQLALGLKLGLLLTAARWPLIALGFSSGTNDSTRFKWQTFALLFSFVTFGFGFVGLGIAALVTPNQWIASLFLILAGFVAYATFRIYGWFFQTNRFDLMTIPQQSGSIS